MKIIYIVCCILLCAYGLLDGALFAILFYSEDNVRALCSIVRKLSAAWYIVFIREGSVCSVCGSLCSLVRILLAACCCQNMLAFIAL